jgi:hypothetical protein
MNGLIWAFKNADTFVLFSTMAISFFAGIVLFNVDYFILLTTNLIKFVRRGNIPFEPGKPGSCLPGLLIIPSLLRDQDDLKEIIATVESCGNNGYPNDLFVVVSVDGSNESPENYQVLGEWMRKQNFPSNVRLHLTSREVRGGKIMAIDAGVKYMQGLVTNGVYPKFPDLYFSVDADSIMGEHALEKVVVKLLTPHYLTGNPMRVVAGFMAISPKWFWQGWRQYFTTSGQNYLNVAREFLVYGFHRLNRNLTLSIGLPGPLYVVWSDVLIQAPKYMAFVRTITWKDWIKWWFGYAPPKFSEYTGPALPEALSGGLTDDTTMAIISGIAQWKNGKLSLDAPRTPLHAFGRMMWNWLIERAHQCVVGAKVYTFSPPTLKSLWAQRIRWNTCRPECGERFFMSFLFHWDISFGYSLMFIERMFPVGQFVLFYVLLPFYFFKEDVLFGFVVGYLSSFLTNLFYTVMALILEPERKKYWRILLSLPTRDLYCFFFGYCTTAWGMTKDIFGNGLNCKFLPEETLIAGGGQRVALLYRCRRFFSLCVRSILYGDVPFGTFWWGFKEHEPYVSSAFTGWTSGKKGKYSLRK